MVAESGSQGLDIHALEKLLWTQNEESPAQIGELAETNMTTESTVQGRRNKNINLEC